MENCFSCGHPVEKCVCPFDDSPETEAAYQAWLDYQHHLREEEPRLAFTGGREPQEQE